MKSSRQRVLIYLLSVMLLLCSYGAFRSQTADTCLGYSDQRALAFEAQLPAPLQTHTAAFTLRDRAEIFRPVAAPVRIARAEEVLTRTVQKLIRVTFERIALPAQHAEQRINLFSRIRFIASPSRSGSDDTLLPVHFGRVPPLS